MSLLLETIRIHNGVPENLACHEDRITWSQFGMDGHRLMPPIREVFEDNPPPETGLLKCRLIYNRDLYKVEYLKYNRAEIKQLKIVKLESVYYPYKLANRQVFKDIQKDLPKNTEALIVIGDRVTDTTYTNVAFLKGNVWQTPVYPLLKGTRRCSLLKGKILHPADISVDMLSEFSKIRLFNAMIPWSEAIEFSIEEILA